MRPKSTISTPKVDDEHPHHFHTSFHCWERGCPSGDIKSNLDIRILYNENLSLGPGSAVGEKRQKRGQIGKYREPSGILGRGKGRRHFPLPRLPIGSLRSTIFVFFRQRRFFSFFAQCGAWSQATETSI